MFAKIIVKLKSKFSVKNLTEDNKISSIASKVHTPAKDAATNLVNSLTKISLIALILALFQFMRFYPGFFHSDSFLRIDYFNALLKNKVISTNELSIGPSLVMFLFFLVFKNITSYILIQAFLFYFSIILVLKKLFMIRNNFILALILIILSLTPVGALSVFMAPEIFICSFLLIISVLSQYTAEKEKNIFLKTLYFLLLSFILFWLILFRPNAISILPFVVIFSFLKLNKLFRITIFSILFSILLFFTVQKSLTSTQSYNWVPGLMWDNVGVLKSLKDSNTTKYEESLGILTASSEYKKATPLYEMSKVFSLNKAFGDRWVWDFQNEAHSKLILKDHLKLLYYFPLEYFFFRIQFLLRGLGITQPILSDIGFGYDRPKLALYRKFALLPVESHLIVSKTYYEIIEPFYFIILYPYIIFLIGFLILYFSFKLNKKIFSSSLILFGFSLSYYCFFLLHTQSFQLRYFLPSLLILFINLLGFIGFSIQSIFEKMEK